MPSHGFARESVGWAEAQPARPHRIRWAAYLIRYYMDNVNRLSVRQHHPTPTPPCADKMIRAARGTVQHTTDHLEAFDRDAVAGGASECCSPQQSSSGMRYSVLNVWTAWQVVSTAETTSRALIVRSILLQLRSFPPYSSTLCVQLVPPHHTKGMSIFLLGTLSPNSFFSATCFLTLHCAICAPLTSTNTHAVSVCVNTANSSHAASSNV